MKKPYTNNTKKIQHLGSVMVMPGCTREIEEMHIQAHSGVAAPKEKAATEENPHVLFLSANVKTIQENIGSLSDDDLDAVEKIERASNKTRQGVIKAIAEERLTRAAAANASEVEQFIASLDGMSDAELVEQKELYTDEPDAVAYLDAVNTEIESREKAANEND